MYERLVADCAESVALCSCRDDTKQDSEQEHKKGCGFRGFDSEEIREDRELAVRTFLNTVVAISASSSIGAADIARHDSSRTHKVVIWNVDQEGEDDSSSTSSSSPSSSSSSVRTARISPPASLHTVNSSSSTESVYITEENIPFTEFDPETIENMILCSDDKHKRCLICRMDQPVIIKVIGTNGSHCAYRLGPSAEKETALFMAMYSLDRAVRTWVGHRAAELGGLDSPRPLSKFPRIAFTDMITIALEVARIRSSYVKPALQHLKKIRGFQKACKDTVGELAKAMKEHDVGRAEVLKQRLLQTCKAILRFQYSLRHRLDQLIDGIKALVSTGPLPKIERDLSECQMERFWPASGRKKLLFIWRVLVLVHKDAIHLRAGADGLRAVWGKLLPQMDMPESLGKEGSNEMESKLEAHAVLVTDWWKTVEPYAAVVEEWLDEIARGKVGFADRGPGGF